jgi:ABC-type multidrug transport system ATPase subunit
MTHLLEVDCVILEFNSKRVLHDIYMKSETGKISGLLGRNGAGKSCLMKIIYGALIPNDRSVQLNGVSMYSGYRNPDDIRFLPQRSFIPGFLTLKKVFKDFELDFLDFTNEFPGFGKFYNAKLKSLSGGERRIVEIFTTLSSKSKFCILDEPFTQVMPVHIDIIKKLIVREKGNKGIIITDHLYKFITDICDDLYVIANGKTYLTKNLQELETLGYARINDK